MKTLKVLHAIATYLFFGTVLFFAFAYYSMQLEYYKLELQIQSVQAQMTLALIQKLTGA
jgi:hypothetical protein